MAVMQPQATAQEEGQQPQEEEEAWKAAPQSRQKELSHQHLGSNFWPPAPRETGEMAAS